MKHGDIIKVDINKLVPNDYNPNEMSDAQFRLLNMNVQEFGMLQIPIVKPLKDGKYEIIDGEHKWEAAKLQDFKEIHCIVVDPKRVDGVKQMLLTSRMNQIHGTANATKLRKMIQSVLSEGEYEFDELAEQFGFSDEDEFEELWKEAKDTLPDDPDLKAEFDAAKKTVKTVDDLTNLVEKLLNKYGDTLPAHFMIVDHGGKDSLWVKVKDRATFAKLTTLAREVAEKGITFDSAMVGILTSSVFTKWIEKHKDALEPLEQEPNYDEVLDE